jgi:phage terminase large subunit-like protein
MPNKERKIFTPDNSFLLEYHARIECGEIIVGQELWQELQNLKEDLHNDAYYYDTQAALLRMDFMENCVRLTKSPFYNKPMKLMLWQKAFIETVYSFKMSDTSFDRFKKVILLIARKNTKSETCSALGLSELIVGNEGADIVCSSNDDNQASITYDAIDTMRMLIDPNNFDTKRNQRFILNKTNGSKIFKLSDRTRNKEGRNIDFAIIDETHEMKENVIGKSIEQSQSLKDNPKFINITTEGFVVDGYLDDELKKARAVIWKEDDGAAAQRLLPWFYTQDSEQEIWQNRASWVKSNPTLGTVKKWDYLDEQVDLARKSKADRIFVLSKDFNIKQNSAESWLNLEDYDYEAVFDLEDFRGSICLGAVDLSETTDLTCAKVLMMKPGEKTKYVLTMYFIPESKLEDSDDRNAGAKYKEWAGEGLLTITDGNDIDLAVVADWFYSLYTEYDIKLWKCGYDQRFAKDWINRMNDYGWTKENEDLIMILQNAQTLSNAMRLVEADFKHKLINYNGNKMDKWCLKNAGIKVDDKNQCICVKQENSKRIDGAVTFVILYEMFRRYRTEFRQAVKG